MGAIRGTDGAFSPVGGEDGWSKGGKKGKEGGGKHSNYRIKTNRESVLRKQLWEIH